MIEEKYEAMLMREKQRQLPPATKERRQYTHKEIRGQTTTIY